MATLVGRNNHMRCCDQRWHRNISVNECKEGKSSFDCQVSWPRVPTRTTEIWVRCRLGNDMQWCTTHWYPAAPVRQKCQQPDHSQLRWFAQTASDADYWSRDISTDPTSAWNFSCDSGDVFFLYSLGLLDPGCTWSDRYSGHIASALLRPVAAWVLHGVGQLRVGKRMCRQGTRPDDATQVVWCEFDMYSLYSSKVQPSAGYQDAYARAWNDSNTWPFSNTYRSQSLVGNQCWRDLNNVNWLDRVCDLLMCTAKTTNLPKTRSTRRRIPAHFMSHFTCSMRFAKIYDYR
jgi:hypothetical protein